MHSICVFCGSNSGKDGIYAGAARSLARAIVGRGMKIVYGGGNIGLMGELAQAALAAGGHVAGVAPRRLFEKEVVHTGLSALHLVDTMHERKALMAELSDAFVALPGGLGTYEEMFEVLAWAQLGFHHKPCGLLNVAGFYDRLTGFLDHAVAERFLKAEHRAMLLVENDAQSLIERLASHRSPQVSKWIDRETGMP
jgi:uncharacterized protein (TIGR00730 family)